MNLTRRAVIAATLATPLVARAQGNWTPTRPLRLVVPFAPGGLTDILTRAAAEQRQARIGQPVIFNFSCRAGPTCWRVSSD